MILESKCYFPIEVGEKISLCTNGHYEVRILTFRDKTKEFVVHYPRYTMHCEDDKQSIELEGFAYDDIRGYAPVRVWLHEEPEETDGN